MDTLTPLICDLLEWLSRTPRTHAELIDGWRTSCPRLSVWEDALSDAAITWAECASSSGLASITMITYIASTAYIRRERWPRMITMQSTQPSASAPNGSTGTVGTSAPIAAMPERSAARRSIPRDA